MKLIPGEAYGNIYGTHWTRYYGNEKQDPVRTDKSKPLVIGANGFPVLAPASSQKLLGNSQPDWIGGITNTVNYKNLSLTLLVDARWGQERFNRLENFLRLLDWLIILQTEESPGCLKEFWQMERPIPSLSGWASLLVLTA